MMNIRITGLLSGWSHPPTILQQLRELCYFKHRVMTFPDPGLRSDPPQKRYMGVRVKMPVRELLRKIRLSKGLDPAHSKVRTLLEFRKVAPRGLGSWYIQITHSALPVFYSCSLWFFHPPHQWLWWRWRIDEILNMTKACARNIPKTGTARTSSCPGCYKPCNQAKDWLRNNYSFAIATQISEQAAKNSLWSW